MPQEIIFNLIWVGYKNISGLIYALLISLILIVVSSCGSTKATQFDFPSPVNTESREIQIQQKKVYSFGNGSVNFDNTFDGARLNHVSEIGLDSFLIQINPENEPINPSPFYAFRLWSAQARELTLILNYPGEFKHRYYPKLSNDGAKTWNALSNDDYFVGPGKKQAILKLDAGPDTTWIAAQELWNSARVAAWGKELSQKSEVHFLEPGFSKLGRPLICLDIYQDSPKGKEIIVLLSRQHPPEVTGFLALKSFLDALLEENELANAFRKKYRILVYPLMNPDGVDLGHWRHNAGGIDLNRDWAYYRQPETRKIADHIVLQSKKNNGKVILGLDFHSTYQDVYYTFDHSLQSVIPGFKNYWIENIKNAIYDYEPDDQPSGLAQPISKGWFYLQFKAEGITFEIGDETPRDFINEKGKTAAREMMKLLVFRGE